MMRGERKEERVKCVYLWKHLVTEEDAGKGKN